MKSIATLVLLASFGASAIAQTTITNGGFENWGGNPSPGIAAEPTGWYSNKSGSSTAMLGPQTCFQDNTTVHSGTYSVQVITESITIPVIGTEYINGVVTTGVVNAPTTSKADGYIGTINYSTASDDRRMSFTGRPDSLVGWYQYTQSTSSGGSSEQGKVRAILHTSDYFDPETPTTYHAACISNKIADALFLTPMSNVAVWTRFSVPFNYVSGSSPTYIMINVTSSANQLTSVAGSTLVLDDLSVIYNPPASVNTIKQEEYAKVYSYEKTLCVQFLNEEHGQSMITVTDITGKKVFSESVMNDKFNSYNLSGLNTGVYIYQLGNSSNHKTGKIFIQ